jgi:hypothetical protein
MGVIDIKKFRSNLRSLSAPKLEKEISELNELIDMESDQNTITKLQKEIEDLGALIEMER